MAFFRCRGGLIGYLGGRGGGEVGRRGHLEGRGGGEVGRRGHLEGRGGGEVGAGVGDGDAAEIVLCVNQSQFRNNVPSTCATNYMILLLLWLLCVKLGLLDKDTSIFEWSAYGKGFCLN